MLDILLQYKDGYNGNITRLFNKLFSKFQIITKTSSCKTFIVIRYFLTSLISKTKATTNHSYNSANYKITIINMTNTS